MPVPVYDLAPFLGLARRAGEPQWFALTHRDAQLALAVDEIEGLVQIPKTDLITDEPSPARGRVPQLARIGVDTRAVVDIAAVIETIRQHAGTSAPAQE
jgi:chemotaxis signal transduction protein